VATSLAFGCITLIETLKILVELGISELDELGQRGPGEVAVLVVDRLDAGSIHRQQLPTEEVQLAAQQHELAEGQAKGSAIVAPEISDRLEVRFQVPQQPDHFDVTVGLGFKAAA
jgi:hypothetical protein